MRETPVPSTDGLPDADLSSPGRTVPGPAAPQSRSAPQRASVPVVWGNVHFTGREELLGQVHEQLLTGDASAVLPHTLHGMGGVGKSQIAIEYVYRHTAEYDVIWWIPSEQPTMILTALTGVAAVRILPVQPVYGEIPRKFPWERVCLPHPARFRPRIGTVNAALVLRRPLLVTGPPDIGKSALVHRVTRELGLGRVLRWAVTNRTTLQHGLYDYDDAIGWAQASLGRGPAVGGSPETAEGTASAAPEGGTGARLGDFVRLGPLGTALLPYEPPRVLLIDELDKSDIDLPSDLLHVRAAELGDLPLAIEQAAAWQAVTGMAVSKYLGLIREKIAELMLELVPSPDYPISVAAA
ncbi:hypothetical protein [Streptomyces sasae]|uniref:hypothetical protein n=1 Tax=Streptomyces sasae TaxID=1266772 RepID=UPI0037425B0D